MQTRQTSLTFDKNAGCDRFLQKRTEYTDNRSKGESQCRTRGTIQGSRKQARSWTSSGFWRTLKRKRKRLADLVKENNGLIDRTEKETISLILDMAEAAGTDDPGAFTVTIDDRRYGVITKHYYNIKNENKDAAFAKLRELGLGDLIIESVNRNT